MIEALGWDSYAPLLFDEADLADVYCSNEANSISNGRDDGSIDNLSTVFWKGLRHGTLEEYRTNAEALRREVFPAPEPGQAETRNQNIAGHGMAGYIETGSGQNGENHHYIASWNESYWGWPLALAGRDRDGMLTLWSCSTGASYSGAHLLWRIAQITGRTVRARTGLLILYTQGGNRWIGYQTGSVWQVASPDMTRPPDPISEPKLAKELLTKELVEPLGRLVSGTLDRFVRGRWVNRKLSETEVQQLGWLIFSSRPMSADGSLPGALTARLELIAEDGAVYRARLLADRVLEFEEPGLRFIVPAGLEAHLNSIAAGAADLS